VASKQQLKAQRRAEREAREAAERRKAAIRQRLQIAFGGLLGVATLAAVVFALTSSGGGDGDGLEPGASTVPAVPIPPVAEQDLTAAARKAGCEVRTFESEGQDHIGDSETFEDYKSNPPTSGTHRLTWTEDGFYGPEQQPNKNNWVHALEHGRILFQYRRGASARQVGQLETLFNEDFQGSPGYHQIVLQNDTDMPYEVAAVGWTAFVGCRKMTDASFDALRAFRARYVDKAPEQVP
jgi:hypothetical protein